LASGGNDSFVKLWDLKFIPGGCSVISLLRTLSGHGGTVTTVRFSQTGQILGSAASDKTARIWNAVSEILRLSLLLLILIVV
jgi:WD40 repeat protein